MSPSVLQLQALGLQDVYLTQNPDINLFKYNYYKYVNFATETVKLSLNEIPSFGKKTVCDIPKKGHLLTKLHLHLRLPALTKVSGEYLSWSDAFGYSVFDEDEPIELEIGGVVVDRLYPRFLDMYDDLSNASQTMGKNLMILKSDVYTSTKYNAEKEVDVMIPLDFWFTKQYNSALPLLSMYHQDIRINFKLKNFDKVVNYDGDDPTGASILDASVFAEYVFLDDFILEKFQKQKHTFMIEQVHYNGSEIIPERTSIYNTPLKFNSPVKELLFGCVTSNNIVNNNHFVYSNATDGSIIESAALSLDGRKRFEYLPEIYYRAVFPQQVHSVIPLRYIYCMPFCINPEKNQPSGSLNMSRFNDVVLSMKLAPNNEQCSLFVYAVSYNVVTIENGTLTMEFIS